MAKKANETTEVTIKPAKGRPMLQWVGKRPLKRMTAFPAQKVEAFGENPDTGGRLYHGDNKEVLCHLLANGYRGKVDLIYIDPPFDSGADYVRKVELRGPKGGVKVEGEAYTLGEQVQYTDIWANDNYLQFMFERLMLLKELLADDGSIFLHCDWHKGHYLRLLMDEVFASERMVNELIWQHQIMGGSHDKRFPKAHETIYWYSKGPDYRLNSEDAYVRVPFSDYVRDTLQQDEDGRWYYERRRMSRKATAEEAASKAHTRTYVENVDAGTVATDVWTDMLSYQELPNEREGLDLYPTQKTTKLLTRIISAASKPGGTVLDCFAGSGVVMKVAQKLGRRWIGCDINKGAIQTTSKRLQTIIQDQVAERVKRKKMPELIKDENAPPEPAQYGFTVYRVNDYDLQIQHNEAVNLACEHIGVTRTKADAFFDGTLGKRLVKITPFNHPLSPLDLEEIKKELAARTEEQRDILVVSLGKELAVEKWLDDWNRLRKRGDVPNKIEVVELRTDPKYGKFFAHKPATARVEIKRGKEKITVEIKDFISPSIIQRLEDQSGVLKPRIDDWRAMVDCVMIDPAYDGAIFNVTLSDIPEKKADFVQGVYELDPPKGKKTTVAVKIVDMLGEEVVVTKDV